MTVTARRSHLVRLLVAAGLVLLGFPIVANALPAASAVTALANPDLDPHCGIDVALVIDRSGSIGSNNTNVQAAAQALVTALVGTGSRVEVDSFSATATAEPGSSSLESTLVFHDPATLTIPTFPSSGTTNWDDGLEMIRRGSGGIPPLTVMVTDGDPTQHNLTTPDGHGLGTGGTGSSTSTADIDNAVTEANLLRASTHMFVVGVGTALSSAASQQRIKDISGPDALTFDASGTPNIPFGTADYTLVTQFTALKATFAHFVRELCGPSLNIVKKLQMTDGSTVTADGAHPFSYTATVAPTPASWQRPASATGASGTLTTDNNGVANFKWEPTPASATSAVVVDEAASAGWVPNGQKCSLNRLDGTPQTVIVNNIGSNAAGASKPSSFAVTGGIGPELSVNCEVYNRELRASTVSVNKATVPAGRPESFTFHLANSGATVGTLNGITDATAPTAFAPVLPGSYTVSEDAAANYSATGATCDDKNTQAVESASPVNLVVGEQQAWLCSFTNTAANGTITVVKHLTSAPAGVFGFASTIPGHAAFSLAVAGGHDASTDFSVAPLPNQTYAVSETNPAPFSLTGASCSDGSPAGAISVSPGEHIVCTFTNAAPTPTISVTKTPSVNSIGEPGGNVTYTATITNTSVAPLHLTQLTDTIGGSSSNVLPGCPSVTMAPGATITCTFVGAVSGDAHAVVHDTVAAVAADDYGHNASGSAGADVAITDVAPTITMNKTAGVATVQEPGGPVTYTVSVTNTSAEGVTLTTLTDAVAGGASFDVTHAVAPVTATDCTLAAIAAHGTYTCHFTTPVTGVAVSQAGLVVPDTARASAVDNDGSAATAEASAAVRVLDVKPSLTVTKTPSTPAVDEPGANVTYTVTIHNTSVEPIVLSGATDQIGAGAPFAVCPSLNGTTMAVGASATCTFTQAVTGNGNTAVTDTVTVSAHDDEDNQANGSASATIAINDVKPSLQVTKQASVASVDEPGGPVTYTVGVTNTSVEPVVISGVTDKVGAAGAPFAVCASLDGTTLAAGASASCSFSLSVIGDAGQSVSDTATVSAHDDEGNQADGHADAMVRINDVKPAIDVTKTTNHASVPEPGGDVTYTVAVHNASVEPVTLTSLTDVVGAGTPFAVTGVSGTSCALPQTIAVGATYSCAFTLHAAGNGHDVVNDTVTAAAQDNEHNTATGHASAAVSITDVVPSIAVTKTASTTSVPEPGGDVTYTVAAHNTSVEPVTLTALADKVGSGAPFDVTGVAGTTCSLPRTIAIGASYSCTFTQHVTGDAHDVVSDTVTATAHDDEGNEVTGNGSEAVNITDVSPAITVTKTADHTSVPEPGGDVAYTVVVHNGSVEPVTLSALADKVGTASPFDVTGVAGTTCSLPQTIAVAASYSCTFSQHVAGNAHDVVSDTVTATAHDNDGNEVTGAGSEAVTITDVPPTGTVSKTAGTTSVPEPGAPVQFEVRVHNSSVEPVHITSLTDAVGGGAPFDVTLVAGAVTATTCGDAIGHVMAVGGDYACHFTMAIAGNAGATVTDVIAAALADDDGNTTTPTDAATVTVTDVLPTIAVTKSTASGTVDAPGGNVLFTVVVANTSPEPVTIDSITDSVAGGAPLSVTTVAAPITATDCATGGVLAAAGQPGSTMTCHFTITVAGNDAATIADVVRVSAHDDEGNHATGDDGATATLRPAADLAITKKLTQALVAGANGVYQLAITNNGPSAASGVVVVDTLPTGLTATSASGDGWLCAIAAGGGSATCSRPALATSATSIINVTVDVAASLAGQAVTNVASVAGITTDKVPDNNRATITSTPAAPTQVLGEVIEAPRSLARTGGFLGRWALQGLALMLLGLAILLNCRTTARSGPRTRPAARTDTRT